MLFKNFTRTLLKINSVRICRLQCKSLGASSSLDDFSVDFEKLRDPAHLEAAERNIRERKGVGNIRRVVQLKEQFDNERNEGKKGKLYNDLVAEIKLLPNDSHPVVESYKSKPLVLRQARRLQPPSPAREFSKLVKDLKLLRTEALTSLTGPRSYYFLDGLAELEHALVRYVVQNLIENKFQLVSVPDILPAGVIERCGMAVRGERSQVYFVDRNQVDESCLSGTAEMALAGLVAGREFNPSELPLRLAAVSRCYRAETSSVADEKGIYRVHQFTKVEMFGVCLPAESDALLEEFLALEQDQFSALELDYQTLDMPRHELGAPAYRKHDIEAWFPGRRNFGELSSCSNCTDYQARRLGIRVGRKGGQGEQGGFAHTINGTACAVPRTVMALIETLQQKDGSVTLPKPLVPLMGRDKL